MLDPDNTAAQQLEISQSFPTTAFFDRSGHETFSHQGRYVSAADLEADIRRYAGA